MSDFNETIKQYPIGELFLVCNIPELQSFEIVRPSWNDFEKVVGSGEHGITCCVSDVYEDKEDETFLEWVENNPECDVGVYEEHHSFEYVWFGRTVREHFMVNRFYVDDCPKSGTWEPELYDSMNEVEFLD